MFILKEGSVTIIKGKEEIRCLEKGAYFGERAILQNEIR